MSRSQEEILDAITELNRAINGKETVEKLQRSIGLDLPASNTASEIANLIQKRTNDQVELITAPSESQKKINDLVWATQLSPQSAQAIAEREALERRENFFNEHNEQIASLFTGADYYNQNQLNSLNDLLIADAKSAGDNPSNFNNGELFHLGSRAQSDYAPLTADTPSDPRFGAETQKLVDTKRVLVDSYAAIKFGERYDPKTLDKIIQDYGSKKDANGKAYDFVAEAEAYYKEHHITLMENGDLEICPPDKKACELRRFNTYTKEDLLRQLEVMDEKNMDPKVRKELRDYHLEQGIDLQSGIRFHQTPSTQEFTDVKVQQFQKLDTKNIVNENVRAIFERSDQPSSSDDKTSAPSSSQQSIKPTQIVNRNFEEIPHMAKVHIPEEEEASKSDQELAGKTPAKPTDLPVPGNRGGAAVMIQ